MTTPTTTHRELRYDDDRTLCGLRVDDFVPGRDYFVMDGAWSSCPTCLRRGHLDDYHAELATAQRFDDRGHPELASRHHDAATEFLSLWYEALSYMDDDKTRDFHRRSDRRHVAQPLFPN